MNEFNFYIYVLIMRIQHVVTTSDEDRDPDDLMDLLFEVFFLILVFCSVIGALISIFTTGLIPFESASISLFCMILGIIFLISML